MRKRIKQRVGFTLIEMMMTVVIFATMALATTTVVQMGLNAYVMNLNDQEAIDQGRYGMERMKYEILRLRPANDSAANSISSLPSSPSTSISFVDSSGTSTDFHYDATAQKIYRGSNILVDAAGNLQVSFKDANGANPGNISSIRKIEWTMNLPISSGTYTLRNAVFIRGGGSNTQYESFQ